MGLWCRRRWRPTETDGFPSQLRPDTVRPIARAANDGTSFGAPSPLEVALAERVTKLMPSIERVRFVNSGTEAAMSALRVARAATKRDRIIKFQGCYHGHADAFLVQAGSGALTFGLPDSPGVTRGASADTLIASYNDLHSVHSLFAAHKDDIAAVIVEPIAGNMGVVPPAEGFLEGLRRACDDNGALLIFDEVISGVRAAVPAGREPRFRVPGRPVTPPSSGAPRGAPRTRRRAGVRRAARRARTDGDGAGRRGKPPARCCHAPVPVK